MSTGPRAGTDRTVPLPGRGTVRVRFTDVDDGDMAPPRPGGEVDPDLARRWGAIVDRPLTWLRQVHGSRVVTVAAPGEWTGAEADAAVTDRDDVALAVFTADCAPIALWSPEGPFGVVHAGWRGLVAGVVEAAVERLRDLGAVEVSAALGPCIAGGCYEFGADDLDAVVSRYGESVRTTTATGHPALDVGAGVGVALARAGVDAFDRVEVCTHCSQGHWSHRRDGDPRRQAVIAWRAP